MDMEKRFQQAYDDQFEMWPDKKNAHATITKWLRASLIALLLIAGIVSQVRAAEPVVVTIPAAMICDETGMLKDIIVAANKANDYMAGKPVYTAYSSEKNDKGEGLCGVNRKPFAYFFSGQFVRLGKMIRLDGSRAEMYSAEVKGNFNSSNYMLLTEVVARMIFGDAIQTNHAI